MIDTELEQPTAGDVHLRIPAESAFVAVLRSVTAGLAARCDLTLDEIEDLRIAVDEACALLLPVAAADSSLLAEFSLSSGLLSIAVRVPARTGVALNQDGFGWTVLDALASEVTTDQSGSEAVITLTKRRSDPSP